ncbi:hypothetical protein ACFQAV_12225 [Companilactobacillus huachuanensis]|uniref:Uncharacterized protein n=1 Tax=Companilactobacillus huachuanensis TaxID=2559914 RepID=A0ABW1RQ68_9LACO|nr:hypothetical protein [Companilactobacillus huachuanensis]
MNRKRIALLTGLTILTSTIVNTTNPLRYATKAQAEAAQNKSNLKPNSKYPDISKELDLTSMDQYSSVNLFMNVTLKNFYVKDLAIDEYDQYHLILTPIKSSDQYFLIVTKSKQPIKKNRKISIQGFINGKTRIDDKQIDAGLNQKYFNKKVVSMLADNIGL